MGHGPQPPRAEHHGATAEGGSVPIRKFPTHSPPTRSHLALYSSAPLSASPGNRSGGIPEEHREEDARQGPEQQRAGSAGPLETAAQLESEGTPEWERRLVNIEAQQKRIEDILAEISRSLSRDNE